MSTTSHNNTPWESTSLSLTTITIMSTYSLPSSNPLFSTIITLYMLILLYFPHFFLKLIFSPLFISTFIVLLFLLRFGASQQLKPPGRTAPGPPFEPDPGPEFKTVSLDQEQSNLVEIQPPDEPGLEPRPKNYDEGIKETDTHQEEEDEGAEEHSERALTEPVIRPEANPELKSEAQLEPFGRAQNHGPDPNMYCRKGYLEWEFGPRTKYDEGIKENETHQEKQVVVDVHPGRVSGRPDTRPEIGSEAEQEPAGQDQNHGRDPNVYYCGKGFPEWEFGAPLEVIYEAYEGEEEGVESQNDAFHEENYNNMAKFMLDKYPSLSKYYPESESDSESCSSWSLDDDHQEEREELIEIALDYHGGSDISNKEVKNLVKEVDVEEEDNLIEIDISPTTRTSCHGFSW